MGLSSPFSGCLQRLELLHWNGGVFYLAPDLEEDEAFSWTPPHVQPPSAYLNLTLATILQNSQLLSRPLANNQRTLAEHQLITTITSNQLKDLSHVITQDSNHHWWDSLFGSSTAYKYFSAIFTPLLLIIITPTVLCFYNCWMYRRMRKIHTMFVLRRAHTDTMHIPQAALGPNCSKV